MAEQSVSRGALALHYFLMLAFCTVAAAIVVAAISYFTKISMAGNAMGILIPMFAASLTGQRYYRKTNTIPQGGFAWGMATWFALITLLLNAALFGLIFVSGAMADIIPQTLGANEWLLIAIISAVAALVFLLASRFGFGMGAKSAQKRVARATR
jgi:hypothetical protein